MIEVHLNKRYYFPTNTVEGQIKLKVSDQTMIKCLRLRFYKKQKFLLKKIDGTVPEVLLDEESIVRENTQVFCQNCELDSGEHIFPFRFKLKHEESGTGKVKGYFYDSVCHIESICVLEGTCTTLDREYRTEKMVSIFDKSEEKSQTDIKIKTSTFACIFDKTMLYRILLDKGWYFKGDCISVECFPVAQTPTPVVAGVSGKLYQLVVLKHPGCGEIKPKLMCTSTGFPTNKNRFRLQFRIPVSAGPSITEDGFVVRMLLFVELKLYNGSVVKIKKYLNVGEPAFELPEIERRHFARGKVFAEKSFEY